MSKTIAQMQAGLLQMAETKQGTEEQHVNQVFKKPDKHAQKHVHKQDSDKFAQKQARPAKNTSPIFDQVDSDPVLLVAQKWGVHRETVWYYCKGLGVPAVKDLIRYVDRSPGVQNKSAYLTGTLRRQLQQKAG